MSKDAFSTLSLKPELLSNLGSLGYEKMTPIQAQSLPAILDGKDVIAQAKTGSGKTAAFGLGVLQHLNVKRFRVQTLILCPTRELADQVAKEIRKLARAIHNIKVLTLCGGMPFGPQIGSLEHGAHIIVGTPGRVEEHVRKGNLSLDDLNLLVLDEADRMLEMGFQDALDLILDYAPLDRQTLLFSATYPKEIERIAADVMKKPVIVKVAATHDDSSIEQIFYKVDNNQDRLNAVRLLLAQHRPESTVVFCNTKREAQEISDDLEDFGYSSIALHGDLDQRQRDQALVRFSNKSASVMVATDVAARGLDIDNLDCVINYQLARDTEVHVHRIGRTGRAGSQGIACSLYSDNEHYKILMLEEYLEREIEPAALPPLSLLEQPTLRPNMVTLLIDGGKRQKIRPGDILGALTGENGIRGDQVGKINVFDYCSYVAVMNDVARIAYKKLEKGKLKGRSCRVRQIRN
ncbi:ATP-dependent RNA helicase DbpA [Photobacterium japonica]|uniref:ATP-dependent RNA helicase DbpA n=1 Tax=Photobacterium japonica TaxID=2910235 RepID=UPI003D0BEFD3